MKTCADVEKRIREEMAELSMPELRTFAAEIGVEREDIKNGTREEIESRCVAIEQYAFVH